jgi:hypothetical protein
MLAVSGICTVAVDADPDVGGPDAVDPDAEDGKRKRLPTSWAYAYRMSSVPD